MSTPTLDAITTAPVEQGAISQRLVADAQHPAGDSKVPAGSFNSVNVDRQLTDSGSITRFPNGVKVITNRDSAEQLVPPPGGSVDSDSKGGMVVYDSHHKIVADMDKDKVVHVHTKNGEYSETQDGKVTFNPAGHTSDLRGLHKPGTVPPSKLEDYGVSSDGTTTRYPNGIEYDAKTNTVKVPPDYPNFKEVPHTDSAGHVVSRSGYDASGKLLYTVDGTGMHVPTADGTLNQGANGSVSFKPNETAGTKTLPKLDIHDPLDPTGECANSRDPICGLDMGKF